MWSRLLIEPMGGGCVCMCIVGAGGVDLGGGPPVSIVALAYV